MRPHREDDVKCIRRDAGIFTREQDQVISHLESDAAWGSARRWEEEFGPGREKIPPVLLFMRHWRIERFVTLVNCERRGTLVGC